MRLNAAFAAVWFDAFFRRLARNASWGLASTTVGFALSLAETTLVARFLGAADYGRLALVIAVIVSIRQLVDVRAWEGATRYLAQFLKKRELTLALATVKLALLADAIVATVAYGTSVTLAGLLSDRLLHQPDLRGPITWYALTLLLTAPNATAAAILRVFDRFRDLAVCSVAEAAWHLGLVATVLLTGGRIRWLVLSFLVSDLATAALLSILAGRQVRQRLWPARSHARLSALRPYFKDMGWFTLQTSLRATLKLNRQLDLLILGHFRSPTEVGYYRVARRLGTVAIDLSDPFYFAIFPDFARTWTGARQRFRRLVVRTAAVATVAALPLVLIGTWLAPQLIHVWVGAEYAAAVGPFRVVMVGIGVAVATFWGTPAALGSGQAGVATAAVAAGVLVNLGLLFLLVPRQGPMGAAIGLLGSYVTYGVVISALLAYALRRPPSIARPPGPSASPPSHGGTDG